MQPEEIIQQKEWHQLTEEEKQVLQPLAPDEQEFNLLKKMLLVADETVIDVPSITPVVQEQLHRSLKPLNHKKTGTKKWYYAAAAMLLIAISAWLLLRTEKDTTPEIVIVPPTNKELRKASPSGIDSIVPNISPKKEIIHPEIAVKNNPRLKTETPTPVENNSNVNQQAIIADISTLIKDDSTLMAFVTEVY